MVCLCARTHARRGDCERKETGSDCYGSVFSTNFWAEMKTMTMETTGWGWGGKNSAVDALGVVGMETAQGGGVASDRKGPLPGKAVTIVDLHIGTGKIIFFSPVLRK